MLLPCVVNNFLKKAFIKSLARPSLELALVWSNRHTVSSMRWFNSILLDIDQLQAMAAMIKKKAPCNMLVFGVGYDSVFWTKLNRGGLTVFLEDNENWLRIVSKRFRSVKAFLITYGTKRKDWGKYLNDPSLDQMELPIEIAERQWDIILVDAPAGWSDETPGRMKSINLASRLANQLSDIFVHDCNREVEAVFCDKFLGDENLVKEMKSTEGFLRHYHMPSQSFETSGSRSPRT